MLPDGALDSSSASDEPEMVAESVESVDLTGAATPCSRPNSGPTSVVSSPDSSSAARSFTLVDAGGNL